MLRKLLRPHVIIILGILFAVAWGIWTFILLPQSETPNLPVPSQAEPGNQAPSP